MTRFLIIFSLISVLFFTACETEFIPEPIENAEQIVVEGYLEAGENPAPTYVILTKSLPFFSEINRETFNGIFIRDAEVKVSDGERTVTLTELCVSELEGELLEIASDFLGVDVSTTEVEFCIYVDILNALDPQIGKTYTLDIDVPTGEKLFAATTIPEHVPLDSVYFVPTPGEPVDTLAQLEGIVRDPAGVPNFYRYFTQINEQPVIGGIPSVTDDRLFDGQTFAFPIAKAETRETEFDPAVYGYYLVGDTMTLKWTNVDREHFDFWNTLEFNALNQGPFSSYTRVDFNVEGDGIGIFGGYSVSYYSLVVER